MSVLDDVLSSLDAMSQTQLLLAFIGCIGYSFGQGHLLTPKSRRIAWATAVFAAAAFAFQSADWMRAAMLIGFGVAGMGSFIALVWLTSRALDFHSPQPAAGLDIVDALPIAAAASSAPPRGPVAGGHARSA